MVTRLIKIMFNRLTTANSYWEYEEGNQDLYTNELALGYGDMHRINYKNQGAVAMVISYRTQLLQGLCLCHRSESYSADHQ